MSRNTEKADKALHRYTKTEIGAVRKSWKNRIRVALVYPNTYAVGMSNLGFQAVYGLLNSDPNTVCERAFLPEMQKGASPSIQSLESGKRLRDFDIIAFSVSFENDYENILSIFQQAEIPPVGSARGDPLPLVLAGGIACQLNPEPIAPFIDCFLIGEAEILIPDLLQHYDPSQPKRKVLQALARNVTGAYVPAFYQPDYDSEGRLRAFDAVDDVPSRITRVFQPDLSMAAPTVSAILADETVFDQTFLIEVSRGCPHGCRFCTAGYVYRPYRYRPLSHLAQCLDAGRMKAEKIGLVGAAVSDYPDLDRLCRQTLHDGLRLSFSSLRADGLTSDTLSVLQKSGTKTVAIAPDAGSQRLRDVINKGIDESDIVNAVSSLVETGIPNLRLYFMIGLPTECTDDINAIIRLCRMVRDCFLASSRKKGSIGTITVSLSPFVPKPITPLQWAAMNPMTEIKQKIEHIRSSLKLIPNMLLHADSPRWSFIQAMLSRGSRQTADMLLSWHRHGGNWSKALKKRTAMGNIHHAVQRARALDEVLPWDFIDHGIRKDFLKKEYERALREEAFPPCDINSCTICGACEKRT